VAIGGLMETRFGEVRSSASSIQKGRDLHVIVKHVTLEVQMQVHPFRPWIAVQGGLVDAGLGSQRPLYFGKRYPLTVENIHLSA
jgi:hypothetical protein